MYGFTLSFYGLFNKQDVKCKSSGVSPVANAKDW